jgi:carbon monoxide dehydrogenase subunit G
MIHTTSEIEIERTRPDVFAFMMDPEKTMLWHGGVLRVRADNGMAAGSTGEMQMHFLGRNFESRFEVTENDGVGRTVMTSRHGPLRYVTTQILEDVSPSSTVVKIRVQIDAGTVFKLAEPALESIANSIMESDLNMLKAVLENEN